MVNQILLIHVAFALFLGLTSTCHATTYTVGDNSGWDISTDLDTWSEGKQFVVGDYLNFQYSSTHSVCEVDKDSYDGCNTTDILQSNSDGNTTIPLSEPGDRYFVCGNRLHCFGGMKVQVHIEANNTQSSISPTSSPTGPTSPSSKSNNPPFVVSNSATITVSGLLVTRGMGHLVVGLVSFLTSFLYNG
ncbi:mavicyanin-like [Impatiens glandulifera]|uniref:mavicyanin-like n=1 Tax=Impatiens glandulifera TaxID=253017 RepID=UPI001FB14985|nr:mavicyanin-like [Impatiens glandulifera]